MYVRKGRENESLEWKHYEYPRDGDETMDAPGQYRRTLIDLLRLGHHHGPGWRRTLYASSAPELTEFPEWDALLAAAAEHLAVIHGETPPDWSRDPRRGLARPWWCWDGVHDLPEAERRLQLESAPTAFRRRNVIPDPRDFDPRTGAEEPLVAGSWAWMEQYDPGKGLPWPTRWAIAFENAIAHSMPNRKDEKATVIGEHEGRKVFGASVEFVCASKMRAGRMKDIFDLQFVMGKTGWTWETLCEIHEDAYRDGPALAAGQAEALERCGEIITRWELRGHPPAPEIQNIQAQPRHIEAG